MDVATEELFVDYMCKGISVDDPIVKFYYHHQWIFKSSQERDAEEGR